MTIPLNPEQEQVVGQAILAGLIRIPDDVAGGWPRSRGSISRTMRVPPVPSFWGPGRRITQPAATL
jgi:hypothetical protein